MLGASARTQFDPRLRLQGPAFAEDPMNVPITVLADLPGVLRLMVLVDRNPIRKVLELQPVAAWPAVSFRFKLDRPRRYGRWPSPPTESGVLAAPGLSRPVGSGGGHGVGLAALCAAAPLVLALSRVGWAVALGA